MDVTREPRINDHFYRDFSLAAVLLSPECIFLFFIVTSQFSWQFLIEYFCESWERVLCSAVFQDSHCKVAYASNHTHRHYTISVAFEADRDIRKLLSELWYPNWPVSFTIFRICVIIVAPPVHTCFCFTHPLCSPESQGQLEIMGPLSDWRLGDWTPLGWPFVFRGLQHTSDFIPELLRDVLQHLRGGQPHSRLR